MTTITFDKPVAFITGATSGIGAAYARRLAKDGYDLFLHGRREERLNDLARELESAHGIAAEVIIAELGQPEGVRKVEERIRELERLDLLVNNAGYFQLGYFWELDPDDIEAMIRVHVIATVRFTRAALPGMIERNRGDIINVTSLAAFGAGGHGLETYCATKAYLVSFTESLYVALNDTGIRVHATAPGSTKSEFHSRFSADPEQATKEEGGRWLSAEYVVDRSLEDLERGNIVGIPGTTYRLMALLSRFLPRRIFYRLMIRRGQK